MLVFTDGDDTASNAWHRATVDRARARGRSDGVRDRARERLLQRPAHGAAASPIGGLRKIADETGGGYFELKKTADLAPTFTRSGPGAAQPVHCSGSAADLDNRVHKLMVRMSKPGLTARSAPAVMWQLRAKCPGH